MGTHDLAVVTLRAAVTYLYLLTVVRLSGKRTVGEGTPFDFIAALIVGDMPDDIILGQVPVAQGFVAMGTVIGLHVLVSYAAYRSIRFDRLVGSIAVKVIGDGGLVRDAQARERLNNDDVRALARLNGIADLSEVRAGRIEPSGQLSTLKTKEAETVQQRDLAEVRRWLT